MFKTSIERWRELVDTIINGVRNIAYNYAKIDGLLHIVVSAMLMVVLSMFINPLVATLIVIAIGSVKELILDKRTNTQSLRDFVCNLVGILMILIAKLT